MTNVVSRSNELRTPMPGKVHSIAVKGIQQVLNCKTHLFGLPPSCFEVCELTSVKQLAVGEDVLAGQEMCVVEAMKMQNVLRSPKDGIVKAIHVKVGENLNLEDLIMELD